ncbi:MAG TPA: hypothetical protein VF494_07340 [Candidatus Limnocylindrales bacterium]
MQTLTYVLYQLDEAAGHIDGGRLEQLRLALLLLDNAAELQLDRRCREERQSEDLRERIRAQAITTGAVAHSRALAELAAWKPLRPAEKKRLRRSFDAKLEYLTERHPIIDPRLARVLSYLHRYRNEAYHDARVRRETIRTAALILFEANCELLITIFRVRVYSSEDDYSWVQQRFGLKLPWGMNEGELARIVGELRAGALPSARDVAAVLAAHLRSRLDELWDGLDFVATNTVLEDRAAALHAAQFAAAIERGEVDPSMDPGQYRASWSPARVGGLDLRIAAVEASPERLTAFERFSEIESELETLERDAHALVSYVDGYIQYQIDLARGK